jgi:S1-C subfamily serine protease
MPVAAVSLSPYLLEATVSKKRTTIGWAAVLLLVGLFGAVHAGANDEPIAVAIRNSVFKISISALYPDYAVPWNPGQIVASAGTGFLIEGGLVMTNAHVSSNARLIVLEKEGDSRKYEARVKHIAHDCDLALLEIMDPSFARGLSPLAFGTIPALDTTVTAIGYPIGGDRLSVTRGVVSRIDYQVYSHSGVDSHLAIQIDAAINPGNSGGPVLQNNAVVGVAFQGYSANVAQNVGYMIPVPVIQRFLKDVADGRYDHYVDIGIYPFALLNGAQRRALGLDGGDFGVMVSGVLEAGAAAGILEVGDVLLTIDKRPIFSDGSVLMDGQRVQMAEVVERLLLGDSVAIELLRGNKRLAVELPLNRPWPYLMHARRHDVRPRFVIYAGLVFQPLSHDFLKANEVTDPTVLYHYGFFLENDIYRQKPEVILLSKILPDPINTYLKGFVNSIVERINGKTIRTLDDVAEAFRQPADRLVINVLGRGRPIVLETAAALQANERVRRGYGVRSEAWLEDSIVPPEWLKNHPPRAEGS